MTDAKYNKQNSSHCNTFTSPPINGLLLHGFSSQTWVSHFPGEGIIWWSVTVCVFCAMKLQAYRTRIRRHVGWVHVPCTIRARISLVLAGGGVRGGGFSRFSFAYVSEIRTCVLFKTIELNISLGQGVMEWLRLPYMCLKVITLQVLPYMAASWSYEWRWTKGWKGGI